MTLPAFSYRDDPAIPDFDDSRPLFVFDNICVLCSGGASFLMQQKRGREIRFASAQGDLGRALYRHYGLELDDSYLFLADGRGYTMSDGYFVLARKLGGWWRLAGVFRLIPRPMRDWIYGMVAQNRYEWFGRTEACALLTEEQKARLL